jgi:hypothetical protein
VAGSNLIEMLPEVRNWLLEVTEGKSGRDLVVGGT